jgi:hypothetical protein
VGHDISMNGPQVVEFAPFTGPVTVGHDVTITGTSPEAQKYGGYDICDTTIGHDLTIPGTKIAYEIEVGDQGPQDNEFCSYPTSGPVHVGHDLNVSNNSTGKVDVGDTPVGHDLTVINNTASTATGDTGDIGVDDNTVNHDATCKGNSPALSKDGPEDGPNHVGHKDDGCDVAP